MKIIFLTASLILWFHNAIYYPNYTLLSSTMWLLMVYFIVIIDEFVK